MADSMYREHYCANCCTTLDAVALDPFNAVKLTCPRGCGRAHIISPLEWTALSDAQQDRIHALIARTAERDAVRRSREREQDSAVVCSTCGKASI